VLRSVYYWVAIGDRRSSGCQFQWLSMREAARAIFFGLSLQVSEVRAHSPAVLALGMNWNPKYVGCTHARTHTHKQYPVQEIDDGC